MTPRLAEVLPPAAFRALRAAFGGQYVYVPRPPGAGGDLTDDERRQIARARKAGATIREIAKAHGVTERAVYYSLARSRRPLR